MNKSIKIDGLKFSTSKFTNDDVFLFLMFLNQVITSAVFFHWFTLVYLRIFSFIVSNKDLVIFQMSDFDGFVRRKDSVCGKPSLWSFIVRNASVYCIFSTLSSISNFCTIFLASRLIWWKQRWRTKQRTMMKTRNIKGNGT